MGSSAESLTLHKADYLPCWPLCSPPSVLPVKTLRAEQEQKLPGCIKQQKSSFFGVNCCRFKVSNSSDLTQREYGSRNRHFHTFPPFKISWNIVVSWSYPKHFLFFTENVHIGTVGLMLWKLLFTSWYMSWNMCRAFMKTYTTADICRPIWLKFKVQVVFFFSSILPIYDFLYSNSYRNCWLKACVCLSLTELAFRTSGTVITRKLFFIF